MYWAKALDSEGQQTGDIQHASQTPALILISVSLQTGGILMQDTPLFYRPAMVEVIFNHFV